MPLPELDSAVGYSFGLEFDGVVIKQIQEVSGLKLEQDVIKVRLKADYGVQYFEWTKDCAIDVAEGLAAIGVRADESIRPVAERGPSVAHLQSELKRMNQFHAELSNDKVALIRYANALEEVVQRLLAARVEERYS